VLFPLLCSVWICGVLVRFLLAAAVFLLLLFCCSSVLSFGVSRRWVLAPSEQRFTLTGFPARACGPVFLFECYTFSTAGRSKGCFFIASCSVSVAQDTLPGLRWFRPSRRLGWHAPSSPAHRDFRYWFQQPTCLWGFCLPPDPVASQGLFFLLSHKGVRFTDFHVRFFSSQTKDFSALVLPPVIFLLASTFCHRVCSPRARRAFARARIRVPIFLPPDAVLLRWLSLLSSSACLVRDSRFPSHVKVFLLERAASASSLSLRELYCSEFLCGSLLGDIGIAWVVKSKDSMFHDSNHSSTVIFQIRPASIRWNTCEDINCSLSWFLLSMSLVVLLALFRVSAAVPYLISRVNSFVIAVRS
jgi:hypothetical protein